MLVPAILHPNIFDINSIASDQDIEKILYNLKSYVEFVLSSRNIFLFDNGNIIKSFIGENIKTIDDVNIRKIVQKVYQKFDENSVNLKTLKITTKDLYEECIKVVELNNYENKAVVIYKDKTQCSLTCKQCLTNNHCNSLIEVTNLVDESAELRQKTFIFIPNEIPINDFKLKIFSSTIKYSSEFILYDKQLIPETNKRITQEYKENLKVFFKYFCIINPNIKLKIYTILSPNQWATEIVEQFREDIKEVEKSIPRNIELNIYKERSQMNEFSRSIHQRYIFTDRLNFSCDRGLHLIDRNNQLMGCEINISNDIVKVRNYIENLQLIP